jgi:hypothetical protein
MTAGLGTRRPKPVQQACPQLAKAEMRPLKAGSGFDPELPSAVQTFCVARRRGRVGQLARKRVTGRGEGASAFGYSITSSALTSSGRGTVRPIALAVLRLIVSWYFVGC